MALVQITDLAGVGSEEPQVAEVIAQWIDSILRAGSGGTGGTSG